MDYLPPDPFHDEYSTKRPRRPLRGSLYEKNLVAESSMDHMPEDDSLVRGPGDLGERSTPMTLTQVPLRRGSRSGGGGHNRQVLDPKHQNNRYSKWYWLWEGVVLTFIASVGVGTYFGVKHLTRQSDAISLLGAPSLSDGSALDSCDETTISALPAMYVSCVCQGQSYQPTAMVQEVYDRLKTTFVPNFLPEIPQLEASSCDAANVALYWLSMDIQFEADFNMNDWRLRFLLATVFVHRKGHLWTNSSGWLSSNTHFCDWHGIICSNTRSNVIGIQLPNSLTDHEPISLPTELFLLTNLKFLNLANSTVGGEFPSGLYDLTSLVYLDMEDNSMTGTVGSNLTKLSDLRALRLSNAGKGGSLKSELTNEIGRLTKLKVFHAANLKATGTFPTELGTLPDLEDLDLENCGFVGTLPTELNLMLQLRYLNLGGNSFISTIPYLGNLEQLEVLDLGQNNLEGPFPSEVAKMPFLQRLRLSGATLTGVLPTQLSELHHMACFDVGASINLTGNVPAVWCESGSDIDISVSCPLVQQCLCCTCDALGDPCKE